MAIRILNLVFTTALILPATLIVLMRRRRQDHVLDTFNFAEAKARER